MNRIYKLIWNPQLRALVVASELATGHAAGSRSARLLAPRLAVLSMACALGCWGYVAPAMAQSAELADIAQLVERYSQPVEDLNALVARAAGQPLPQSPAALQPVAATAAVSVSPQAQLQTAPVQQIQVRQVRHAGLSVTPAAQIQTVTSALSSAAVSNVQSGADVTLAAVSESLAGSGSGQAGAPAGRILPMLRPRDPALGNRTNVVREGITGTVGLVESGVGKLLDKTHLGKVADGLLTGVGDVVGGVGNVLGAVVGGVTGSQALAGTVTGLTGALDDGLDNVGDNLEDTNLAGAVGAVGGAVNDAGNAVVGGALGAVGGVSGSTALGGQLGGTVDGLTGGVANGLTSLVGQVTGNPAPAPLPSASTLPLSGVGLGGLTGSSTNVSPMALPPGDPRLVSGTSRTSGLVVGTGGLVGTVGTLLGPTLQDLLGGDGYVRNGDTTISSANIVQAYSVTNVLGIPVVNLSPVGTLLDGLGGVTTGSNSHLTILGGATSDSYIYNINNGDPNGLLGLVLPDTAPAWAQSCLNALGLASIDCWAVNAAQDYQVIIGDGAFANGSKEVVIGTNASHRLPLVDANDVFLGDGTNDPTNPTGVPTGDYDARMGHSVVIGDNATGTANAQTLLGAGATSDKANSVALGFRSNASRGGLDNYIAFGMTAPQTSIGEVAVGSAGRERQITHVAAGSEATDAVNVAQLQAALDGVSSGVNPFAVLYADDGAGAPDYTRVALGDGAAPTTVSNLADGEVSASSDEAINGAQLYGTADSLATALGGNAVVDADGNVAAPTYTLTSIDADGTAVAADYNDVGSAFDAVDQSINNVNTRITEGLAGAVMYDTDSNGDINLGQVTFGDAGTPTLLTNVAAGAVTDASSDAITGAQLYGTADSLATALGGNALVDADGTVSAPTYTLTSIDADGTAVAADYNDVGSAFDAVDQSINNVNTRITEGLAGAVMYDTDSNGDINLGQVTFGDAGTPTLLTNVAAGAVTDASSDAITGAQLYGTADSLATALGGNALVDADGTVSAPTYTLSTIDADGTSVAADYNDVGSAFDAVDQSINNVNTRITEGLAGAVMYDTDSNGDINLGQVTFGDAGTPTLLTNVAAGAVTDASSDAITGAQLYGTADSLATALGGNALVDADGTVSAPTYTLSTIDADGTSVAADYNDVGSAFDAVDQSINNVNTRITEGLAGAVMYDTDSNGDINLGQVTFGDAGTPTLLTNVADGAVTATSSDAITGAQLFGSASSVAKVIGAGAGVDADGNLTAPSFAITNIDANLGTSTGTYSDVGTAFSAMDASINNVANNLTVAIGGAVMYDRDANGDVDLTQVTFGDGTTPTLLTNVADGSVAAGSSDALTGSQLYAASASTAAALGGGAGVDGNGAVTAPAYTLTTVAADGSTSSADYDNVGSAFEAVDQSINNINTTVNNGLAGAVRYDVDAAGNVDLGQVTFGDATTQTRLTNVAAGSVDAGSTDAITGAQLFGNASSVAAVIGAGASVDANGNLLAPDFAITDIDGSLGRSTGSYDSVGAAFSAMDASINNVANNVAVAIGGAVRYDLDANGAVDFTRVTFGDGSAPTLLTNVAVGNVAAGSSDATTGAQLFGTADSLATHLGGGATVAADGTVTAPTYVVDGIDANGNLVTGTHTDVGSAFDAVGQSIRNIFNVGIPSTDPLAVHYDVDTTTGARLDSVTLVGGTAGAAVQINNVADGAVVQGSAQAVTGNQLASTNAAVSTYIGGTTSFDPTTGVWIGPNFSLTTIAADGSLSTVSYSDVTSAFDSVSQSLRNVSIQPATPVTGNIAYFDVDSTKAPAQASGGDSVAIGPNAQASGSAAVALGNDATASAAGSVAIGSGAVANRANTVSVGAAGSERQVVNVADGTQDTDAVNVRQLQAVSQSTIRYDQTSSGDIDYTSVTLGSTSSGPTRVRNVATGTAPTDAVNVGQLQAGLTQVQDWSRSYTDQRFNEIGGSIREVDNRASAGIASAMAMAGLPQPYEAGRSMASFAASSFNGEGSIAVGLSGVTEGGRWIYKISGSANTRGDGGVTVGAGIQW